MATVFLFALMAEAFFLVTLAATFFLLVASPILPPGHYRAATLRGAATFAPCFEAFSLAAIAVVGAANPGIRCASPAWFSRALTCDSTSRSRCSGPSVGFVSSSF